MMKAETGVVGRNKGLSEGYQNNKMAGQSLFFPAPWQSSNIKRLGKEMVVALKLSDPSIVNEWLLVGFDGFGG